MVAEVIINSIAKELNRTFDYIVPSSLIQKAKIGSRVFVPFGNRKLEEAYIIGFKEDSEYANKEIIKIEDNILTEENIELAKLMARRYFCNISDCIKLMLPPGNSNKKIENRIKDKTGKFVYLKKSTEPLAPLDKGGMSRSDRGDLTRPTDKQSRLLECLQQNNGVYISDLEAIADVTRAVINTLEKNGYIEIIEEKISRNPFIHKKVKRDKSLKLTEEQQDAYNRIINAVIFTEFLLYGVTGSRKNGNIFATN